MRREERPHLLLVSELRQSVAPQRILEGFQRLRQRPAEHPLRLVVIVTGNRSHERGPLPVSPVEVSRLLLLLLYRFCPAGSAPAPEDRGEPIQEPSPLSKKPKSTEASSV